MSENIDLDVQSIICISRNEVREWKLDDFRQFYREEVKLVEAEKPGNIP